MDDGPFRMPSQPARRNEHEHERPAHHDKNEELDKVFEEPKHVEKKSKEESKPVSRTNRYLDESKSKKPFVVAVVAVVVLVVLGVVGCWAWSAMGSGATGIDSGKFQAIFFTNGQVYFGKLHAFNNDYMKLDDIFYIQAAQPAANNPQKTSDQQNGLTLVKLGVGEIHGPEDEMIIAKDQVLFYENLKTDSKVSKLINQYNDQHK